MSEGKTIVGRVLDAYRYYNRPDISILACHGIVDKALAAAHARGIAEGMERAAKIADLQAKNARTSVKCSFGEIQPVAFEQEAIGAEQIAAAIRAEAKRQKEGK